MQTEEKLKKRIAYEKMLASISERAVLVDDLNDFLSESLRSMGDILDVSRIFIFTYQPVSDTFSCICEWVATGVTTLAALDELKITIPWGTRHLKDGHVINFENTRDIPFERVDYIDTRFSSIGTSWGLMGRTDQVERYTISLVLKEPEEKMVLFSFSGEGSAQKTPVAAC